jgi:hypothetical protein
VERLLMQNVMGNPMLRIDGDNCPKLVLALNGFYRYGRKRDGTTKVLPDKTHPWSDVADAFQYMCQGVSPQFQPIVARTITRAHQRGRVVVSRDTFEAPARRAPSARGWT